MEREIIEYEIDLNRENFEIVSQVDIDVNKVGKVANVSIKRWDGSTKSVDIYDGIDGKDGRDGVDGRDGINGTNGVSLDYNWQGTSLGIKREDESNYDYVNLKGDTGNTGPAGPSNTLTIGTVEKGENASATITGTSPNQVLNLVLPKGDKGDTGEQGATGQTGATGATGNGISKIEKTSTSGLVDTYTITYTNGNTDTYTITNGADGQDGRDGTNGRDGIDGTNGTDGVGIASISKTSTSGLVDTYTITYTNGNTSTYEITNGANGQDGQNGQNGQDGYTPVRGVDYWTSSDIATIESYCDSLVLGALNTSY